ncbi:hypothetical protein RRG08_046697 [Elysia crispata]|uniref:Uncharacterized protein n=1 Tax=Elysia crispata TaxID=231223 RepID=A0AAE1AAF4_9GAST|nr:hypothetical protein RRG08_046697 [Elysia crispata]
MKGVWPVKRWECLGSSRREEQGETKPVAKINSRSRPRACQPVCWFSWLSPPLLIHGKLAGSGSGYPMIASYDNTRIPPLSRACQMANTRGRWALNHGPRMFSP